ncbi:MAG: carotenoid biosynthesis protein [Flavobacteriales bacterium]
MTSYPTFHRWTPSIMVVLHAVGVIGIVSEYGPLFLSLTALNLLINTGLAIHMDWQERHWNWIVAAAGGLVVEIIGVQTGWLFGNYQYGSALGLQVAGVPWILGALWWISLCGFGQWMDRIAQLRKQVSPRWLRAAVGASFMTALDGLIEPVAIRADWWSWEGGIVPWTNYASWWGVAFLFYCLPYRTSKNMGAATLVAIFAVFFILLNGLKWNP